MKVALQERGETQLMQSGDGFGRLQVAVLLPDVLHPGAGEPNPECCEQLNGNGNRMLPQTGGGAEQPLASANQQGQRCHTAGNHEACPTAMRCVPLSGVRVGLMQVIGNLSFTALPFHRQRVQKGRAINLIGDGLGTLDFASLKAGADVLDGILQSAQCVGCQLESGECAFIVGEEGRWRLPKELNGTAKHVCQRGEPLARIGVQVGRYEAIDQTDP